MVFGDERRPGDDLALQFEAVIQFSEHEKQAVRELLEGIRKHEARRWDAARTPAAEAKPAAATKRVARTGDR